MHLAILHRRVESSFNGSVCTTWLLIVSLFLGLFWLLCFRGLVLRYLCYKVLISINFGKRLWKLLCLLSSPYPMSPRFNPLIGPTSRYGKRLALEKVWVCFICVIRARQIKHCIFYVLIKYMRYFLYYTNILRIRSKLIMEYMIIWMCP